MTSDSSTTTDAGTGGGGSGNSYPQRSSLPWAQVVRGVGDTDPASSSSVTTEQNVPLPVKDPQPEKNVPLPVESNSVGFEVSNSENAGGLMKSAWNWNKPSVDGADEVSSTPVMGADSWPALSELTQSSPKSSSSESSFSKSTSDGSGSVSQAPVTSQPFQKPVKTHRQRSMKRGGSSGGGYNRTPPPPPPMPPYPLFHMPYSAFVPAVLDSSVNGFVTARPVAGVGSHSRPVHDHPNNRKMNNVGPRPRGERGPYPNNGHGGRREHHDGDWRGPRSHGGMPHQGAPPPPPPPPRGYFQQAHLGPVPFIAPPPIRPFGAPIGYEMASPPPFVFVPTLPSESYRGAPLLPHVSPPSIFVPGMEPPPLLSVSILRQIEYYFSDANLVKDDYLRSNMDAEGWVPISLIAGFPKVRSFTSDVQLIVSSLRGSTVVEVQGVTVRRRNDWKKWVNPPINFPSDSSSQSPRASTDGSTIETSIQKLTLDESKVTDRNDTHNKEGASNMYSVGSTDSSKLANSEATPGNQHANPESSTFSYQDL